jgi:complement component 1 Q subcomponent-binding protein
MGTLTFYASTEADDSLFINDIEFSADSAAATADTADAEHERRVKYAGPKYADLDEKLQEGFSEYLDERGIDENLVAFISEYSDWKEQKEYVKWLEAVQKFVSK